MIVSCAGPDAREIRLSGRAGSAVERRGAGQLSREHAVEKSLAFLEKKCARQAVPDVGQAGAGDPPSQDRRKEEPMAHWADRRETGYQSPGKALARAMGMPSARR